MNPVYMNRQLSRTAGHSEQQMAKSGDGEGRSESRRLTAMISLRLDPVEKKRFEEAAASGGFQSLSNWALDRLRNAEGMRARLVVLGKLGRLGVEIHALAQHDLQKNPVGVRRTLEGMQATIVSLQRALMEVRDDREGDL